MKFSNRLQWAVWIIAGGILLCYWGLFNGYPFVYPDTGTYVFSGFTSQVPIDRPLSYGLFIRHVSMMESLFWVIYAQGILTSLIIYLLFRHFLGTVNPALFIGTLAGITACTNGSLYVSYIMPDLFTPIFFACLALLLLAEMPGPRVVLVVLLGWLSMIMHNAHLLEGLLLVVLLLLASISVKFRAIVPIRRTFTVGLLVLAGWVGVRAIHWMYSGKFESQQASHVFAMARLNEMGLLKPYLDRACVEGKNYPICAFRDSLPDDFLWSGNSPAHKDGGWMSHRDEYREIIAGIMTTPKLVKDYLIHTLNGAFNQFFYFRAEDTGKWLVNTPPYGAVLLHFPKELGLYKISHQNHRDYFLDFSGMNTRQQYLFFGLLVLFALVVSNEWWKSRVPAGPRWFLIFCMAALVFNALVCSAFASITSRYQGRLLWLALLAGFMTLYAVRGALLDAFKTRWAQR